MNPLSVQFYSFSCSFRQTLCQVKDLRYRPMGNHGSVTGNKIKHELFLSDFNSNILVSVFKVN